MSIEVISIDGSVLEGGGQILRNALSLSCILRKPLHIFKIRAGRPKPGLSAQHLKGVQLLKEICNARVEGDVLGSTELHFKPQTIRGGSFLCEIGTAGSIALVLQVALPVALFANSNITIELRGGTNAAMAPQIDYITEIFRPNLEKFGASFDFDLFKRGYFPKGGGHCKIDISPIKCLSSCIVTDFGRINRIFGWSFVAGVLPIKVAHEMTEGAKQTFSNFSRNVAIEIETYKESQNMAEGNCSGIILGCETSSGCSLGGSGLGNRQERAMDTGRKAALEVVECLKCQACVDAFCQDQLIIFMSLANGVSKIKTVPVTLHTKTSIYIAECITQTKFHVVENNDGTCTIECKGIGFNNTYI